METNTIKEIFKGHYQVILDFPKPIDLNKIIDFTYKYVWGIQHNEGRTSWGRFEHTLFGQKVEASELQARNIEMEYLIKTKDFLKLIPSINQTIHIIQTNIIPPNFLDMKKLQGKGRYEMLKKEVDYLFELEMPGAADYAPIVSPNIKYLERIVQAFSR